MLSDITVVELGTRTATAYCGKLLRDMGARVLRPATAEPSDPAALAYARHLHAGNEVLAGAAPAVPAGADVVLCDGPGPELTAALAARGTGARPLVVSISEYGLDGPFAGRPATDFTLQAEAGISVLHDTGDRPPVAVGVELAELTAGAAAAGGVVGGLLHDEAGTAEGSAPEGRADVDVSCFEAVIGLLQFPWLFAQIPEHPPYPVPQAAVPGLEEAADGWVSAVAVTPAQWAAFKAMCGVAELDDSRFDTMTGRVLQAGEAHGLVRRFTRRHTIDELVRLGEENRVPITPVATAGTVGSLVMNRGRDAFVTAGDGTLAPAPFFRWTPSPATRLHPAGGLRRGSGSRPLAGLRVVELCTFQAGPLVGEALAALGADVVKVEAVKRPDLVRFGGPTHVDRYWERLAPFVGANVGTRNITVDFTTEEGLEILRSVLRRTDVVLDNFLPRVLDGRGLGHEALRELNPDVLVVRMPAWGLEGPWRDRPGFTYSVNATCGLSDLTGYPDGDPLITGTIIDPFAALHSTAVVLAAVRRQCRTGAGGLLEIPLCDVATQLTARTIVAVSVTGVVPSRTGNRGEASPQGIYRCGDDEWLALAITSDEQWRALGTVPGAGSWAGDPRYADAPGRHDTADELDDRLGELCRAHAAAPLADRLRDLGVPAAVLATGLDFHEHPQLVARGRVYRAEHGVVGPLRHLASAARLSAAPVASAPSGSPLFGQHNREVLTEIGLTADAIDALEASGAIGTVPFGSGR